MFTFKVNDKNIVVDINDKQVTIEKARIYANARILNISVKSAIKMYLEDEGYLNNEEQNNLTEKAKKNKATKVVEAGKGKSKKTTTRKKKSNPTKKMVIDKIAELLPTLATNVVVENAEKIITFTIGEDNFKIDLTQKRKPKNDK